MLAYNNSILGYTLKNTCCTRGEIRMSIVFECRHCTHTIGTVSRHDVTDTMLGIDTLTEQEQKEMIHYEGNGTMHVQSICEPCEEMLGNNPELHELHYFIQ